jgi:UDP-2-acetamido-3-amino-2,3-dideoxy-glucuronate N-acetyltransferase
LAAGNQSARVAVIGTGAWGVNHVRAFHELGVLRTICDADEIRLGALADRYPTVRTTPKLGDVLSDPDIAAVVIAAPAVTHATLVRDALAAGKDVLVEKPMALTVDDAEDLVARAAAQDRVLAVGHVLEYHPAVVRLREMVAAGDVGRVRYLYSNRLNFGRIRTEENVLWSFAPHDIAIMLRLLDAPPVEVSCSGGSYLNPGVADTTLTSMTFANDVRAHIYVSWLHPFKEQRFVVIGDKAMVVFDDTASPPDKLVVYEHAVEWADGRVPVARKMSGIPVVIDDVEPLLAQARAFIDAVSTRKPPLADGRSGLEVLRVLHAAQLSLERSGAPVLTRSSHHAGVHPTAIIDDGATIGASTIWHFSHVMADARIGDGCTLGQNVFVGRGVQIGARCKIQNDVSVFDGVTLEDDVFVGPGAVFTNVRNPRAEVDRRHRFDETRVRSGATIGANATIVCGTTIGRYAFIGAGSVVTTDVADHALVVGNPARAIGWMCVCGERLANEGDATCAGCGRRFESTSTGLREV